MATVTFYTEIYLRKLDGTNVKIDRFSSDYNGYVNLYQDGSYVSFGNPASIYPDDYKDYKLTIKNSKYKFRNDFTWSNYNFGTRIADSGIAYGNRFYLQADGTMTLNNLSGTAKSYIYLYVYLEEIQTMTDVPVTAPAPTRTGNTIHIPTSDYVSYLTKPDEWLLMGDVELAQGETLVIQALTNEHPTPSTHQYVIEGTSEWTFTYEAVITTAEETRTEPIAQPETQYQDTSELPEGEQRTIQEGRAGEETIVEEVTYEDGVEVSRTELSRTTTIEALPTIIEVGTAVVTTATETKTEVTPHATEIRETDELPSGESRVIQEGVDEVVTITEEVTYMDGVETDRVEVSRTVTTPGVTEIIEEGTHVPVITTEEQTKTEPIPYTTEVRETAELNVGESRIVQEGSDGVTTIVEEVTYEDGVEVSRVELSRTVTTTMVPHIVEEGTHVPVITKETVNGDDFEVHPADPIRRPNDSMYEGEEQTIVVEVIGVSYDVFEVTYTDGVETDRVYKSTQVKVVPVQGIIEYGTMTPPAGPTEITAPAPLRSNNILSIPNLLGVEYVDMSAAGAIEPVVAPTEPSIVPAGTSKVLAPGDYTIQGVATIVPRAKTGGETEFVLLNPYATWPYEKYAAIVPTAPEEFERYIIIPESEDIQYFDTDTGMVYPSGTQRFIGNELNISTRLIADNAFLTNSGASWSYTRTGGVTAIKPERLADSTFEIPFHTQIEYVDKLTGTVLIHNDGGNYSNPAYTYFNIEKSGLSPSGLMTVVPRAINGAFLNNPHDEWTFGTFNKGLQVFADVQEIDLETGYPKYGGATEVDATFADYFEVYINGELLTNHQGPRPPVDVENTIEIKVKKDRGHHRLVLDWMRGEQDEPLYIDFQWGTGGVNWTEGSYLEWTAEDTLSGKFTWPADRVYGFLQLKARELDLYTYNKHYLSVYSSTRYNADGDFQIEPVTASFSLKPSDYNQYFDIIINGVKLDPTKLDTPEIGSASLVEMKPGYKEIRLRLTNSDFVWDDSSMLYGWTGKVQGEFDTDLNGDLVWQGIWPDNEPRLALLIHPFMPERALFVELEKVHPYHDAGANIVEIPSHNIIEYFIRETGEILPPGPYQVTRYVEIADRIKWEKRVSKENGQYFIYSIVDDQRFWYYWTTIADGLHYVTALPPTQNGTFVTIPDITGVLYYDMLAREYVTGTFDLRDRQHKAVSIKPIAEYSTYRLTNPDDVWGLTSNFDVYSEKPSRELNRITIPVINGIRYVNKATGQVLTGTIVITEDIAIQAQATGQYKLMSLTNEWTFVWEFIESKRVTAIAPTQEKNWLTIPEVEGVVYVNAAGDTLQGVIYVRSELVVAAEPESELFTLNNPTDTWSFTPVETDEKEIILMDRDPRLVVHINGKEMYGEVFAVNAGEPTTIVLSLLQDSEFADVPYLLDMDAVQTPFTTAVEGRGAALEITFADNTPVELYIGEVTQLTKPMYFTGEGTYLEIRYAGAYVATLYPGDTGRLFINNSYSFTIVPEYGYSFDRPGKFTHNGAASTIKPVVTGNATFAIASFQGPLFIEMSAVELNEAVMPHQMGFNNVYITEYEDLQLISEEMLTRKRDFLVELQSADQIGGLNYDSQIVTNPHTYIINTLLMPFSVPGEYVANRERVTLGYTELFTSALRLREHIIRLDLGEIQTPLKYENSYDFANTAVKLHLPYTNPIELDPAYAIGQTLKLEYLVDVFTGWTTINVRSSLVHDNIFFSTEAKVATEVPFISMKDGSLIGASEFKARLNNNVKVPFIEVIRHKPYEQDSPFNKLTRTTVQDFSGLSGHVTVHDIKLNMSAATLDEENQLRSVLAAGIVIK